MLLFSIAKAETVWPGAARGKAESAKNPEHLKSHAKELGFLL